MYSQMFEQSESEKWRRLGEFMKPYNFQNFPDGYKQMKQEILKAVIYNTAGLERNWKRNSLCDLQIASRISDDFLAFSVPKGSPWNAPLSHLIRKYQEHEILDGIKRKYFASKCTKEVSSQEQFSMLYLSGACIMLVLGIISSFVFFAMEHVINICLQRYRTRRSSYTISNDATVKDFETF